MLLFFAGASGVGFFSITGTGGGVILRWIISVYTPPREAGVARPAPSGDTAPPPPPGNIGALAGGGGSGGNPDMPSGDEPTGEAEADDEAGGGVSGGRPLGG